MKRTLSDWVKIWRYNCNNHKSKSVYYPDCMEFKELSSTDIVMICGKECQEALEKIIDILEKK